MFFLVKLIVRKYHETLSTSSLHTPPSPARIVSNLWWPWSFRCSASSAFWACKCAPWVDSQTATRRAQAVRLIEDLSERMRVNPNALASLGDYIDLLNEGVISDFDDKPDPDDDCTDKNNPCTPAALFVRDLGVWKQKLMTCPLGQASIFVAPWDAGSAPGQPNRHHGALARKRAHQ